MRKKIKNFWEEARSKSVEELQKELDEVKAKLSQFPQEEVDKVGCLAFDLALAQAKAKNNPSPANKAEVKRIVTELINTDRELRSLEGRARALEWAIRSKP